MTRGVITQLRDMIPLRPLTFTEAMRIGEMQAQRFREVTGITEPHFPMKAIADLPRVRLTRMSPFPTSGASHWYGGQWIVVLNGTESQTRQLFTAAHELRHIIDDRFRKLMYSKFPDDGRHDMIEQLCNHFAGCLLMPRPMLKRLYCSGIQDVARLARIFGVSQSAMAVRLSQVGLIDAPDRCDRPQLELADIAEFTSSEKYFRGLFEATTSSVPDIARAA